MPTPYQNIFVVATWNIALKTQSCFVQTILLHQWLLPLACSPIAPLPKKVTTKRDQEFMEHTLHQQQYYHGTQILHKQINIALLVCPI